MAYTEVTETGWFGRIGRSIKGILVGFILLAISFFVLTMNERNAVKDIQANQEIGANVVTVGNDKVDPANDGKLVQFNGPATTDDILKNELFGIAENAIRLAWEAEIYQWEEDSDTRTEKKIGGGERRVTTYTYHKTWASDKIDSSKFKEAGHDNTGAKEYRSSSVLAKNVNVGAFQLPRELIGQMNRSQSFSLEELPESLADKGTISGGVFHTGRPEAPEIGDEKVSFSITPPGEVSIMAVQKGDSLQAYMTASGKTKFLLSDGLMTAEQMVKAEEEKAMILRWALRAVGFVLMFVGFCLLMGPLSVLAVVIPFIGSIVGGATAIVSFLLTVGIGSIVVALSWLAFRPMVGIPLLVVGGGCFVMLIAKGIKGKGSAR